MSDRIYTIQARDVVPGMQNTKGRTVTGVDRDHETVAFRFGPVDTTMDLDLAAIVNVTLPGWSPRELLCSCTPRTEHHCTPVGCMDVKAKPAMDWRVHLRDCPVHRLRLRLWPVGATWDPLAMIPNDPPERGAWIVDGLEVWPYDVVNDFADFKDEARALLRAAFYEPEVQT